MPSQAVQELMDNDQLVFDCIEVRSYQRAKELLDNAKSDKDIPDNPMIDTVFEIQHELIKRKRGKK